MWNWFVFIDVCLIVECVDVSHGIGYGCMDMSSCVRNLVAMHFCFWKSWRYRLISIS